jgi:hypothetical protein
MPKDMSQGRVRNPVTRTGRKFRVKFPSTKLGRMVRCESILESHAALVLERHPLIKSYQEQPERIVYYDIKGNPHEYVPDFRIETTTGQIVDIEVKPAAKLKLKTLRAKLGAIARHYSIHGRQFRIWTDKSIRREPRFSNLKRLHHYAKVRTGDLLNHPVERVFGNLTPMIFAAVAKHLGSNSIALSLIAEGTLRTNLDKMLNDDSLVWLKNFQENGDAAIHL